MRTASKWQVALQLALASALGGTAFQFGGCASAAYNNFNPCGTILNCDPAEWDLIHMDNNLPNFEYNPTCVIPGLLNCSTPISAGFTPTGGVTPTPITGTTGTTGTTTGTRTGTATGTGTRSGTGTGTGFGT